MKRYSTIYALAFGAAIIASATLILLFRFIGNGFDITDEGFYLNWIFSPFAYTWSLTQFGFVFYPLVKYGDISIFGLRVFNALSIYALSILVFYGAIGKVADGAGKQKRLVWLLTGILGTCGFFLFDLWLLTPSYNSLILTSLLVVVACAISVSEKEESVSRLVFLGIAGAVCFLAKPSSAALLAAWAIGFLIFIPKRPLRALFLSGLSAILFLVLFAILVDGTVANFVARVRVGIDLAKLMGGGYTISNIFRIDELNAGTWTTRLTLAVGVPISFLAILRQYQLRGVGFSTLAICIVVWAYLVAKLMVHIREVGPNQISAAFYISIGILAVVCVISDILTRESLNRKRFILGGFLALLPYVYAFGTNGNYWDTGRLAGVFWVLAAIYLMSPSSLSFEVRFFRYSLVSLAASVFVGGAVWGAIEFPYRQPGPLWNSSVKVQVRKNQQLLYLSAHEAESINRAIVEFDRAGIKLGFPILDLTGESPGLVFAVGGMSVGQPWMIGGYSGSDSLATAALRFVDCETLAVSFLLDSSGGKRNISETVLNKFGADKSRDYLSFGSWTTKRWDGTVMSYQVYRPNRSFDQANEACKIARKSDQLK